MYGYIYKTTNLINKKIYIGQHVARRFTTKYLGSGTLITGAILKYGKDKFVVELLERCESQELLDLAEQKWIKEYNSTDPKIGYNQSIGGRDNDKKVRESYRKDKEAKELRKIVYLNSVEGKKALKYNDPNNWVVMYKDGKTCEVLIDKVQKKLKYGWKLEEDS